MILVRSKSKGTVGLLISVNPIPQPPKVVTPGPPKLELLWVGVVLADDAWMIQPLADLVPVVPEEEKSDD